MQKINLFEMTRPEVEQALAAGVDTVIVPLGSTEQHGLHLPLGTDAILGQHTQQIFIPSKFHDISTY